MGSGCYLRPDQFLDHLTVIIIEKVEKHVCGKRKDTRDAPLFEFSEKVAILHLPAPLCLNKYYGCFITFLDSVTLCFVKF